MEVQQPRLSPHDIAVGIDLATTGHAVVILAANGERLARFNIPHTPEGVQELLRRTDRLRPTGGKAWLGFEATGHVWPALAHRLAEAGVPYHVVNPFATHRVREARQMGRDKRDVTDAEQIADLVRIGLVTRTQLMPEPYIELRRTFTEMDRLRQERARLKVLLTHQLYGLFPEFVGNWKSVDAPGALALLRLGLTPPQIASLGGAALLQQARASSRGRRLWGHKVRQIVQKAQSTVACPHGAAAMAGEAQRIVARMDLLEEQIEVLGADLRDRLGHLEEARYLATIPGLGWLSVAGLLAEIGPIDRYRSGRQLIKLAGTNPGRRQTGASDPATEMTHRGRGRLRRMLFMTTLAAIRVNPRLREHFDHLTQRQTRPLPKMVALGACMNKLLLYAFAVMKHRVPFRVDHRWKEHEAGAA